MHLFSGVNATNPVQTHWMSGQVLWFVAFSWAKFDADFGSTLHLKVEKNNKYKWLVNSALNMKNITNLHSENNESIDVMLPCASMH